MANLMQIMQRLQWNKEVRELLENANYEVPIETILGQVQLKMSLIKDKKKDRV